MRDNTDTSRDAGADGDHAQDDEKTSLDLLSDANEQFQTDSDLGEVILQGPIGFHSFYDNEEADEYLTTGDTTLLHRAFDRVIEEIHLDEETVEESWGEVTPETVGKEVERQLDEYVSWGFSEVMGNEIERILDEREGEDSGEGGDAR